MTAAKPHHLVSTLAAGVVWSNQQAESVQQHECRSCTSLAQSQSCFAFCWERSCCNALSMSAATPGSMLCSSRTNMACNSEGLKVVLQLARLPCR